MTKTRALIVAIATLVAGCAGEPSSQTPAFSLMHLGAPVEEPPESSETSALDKTSASKVLSAIAFERVTGNPVDPARLLADR